MTAELKGRKIAILATDGFEQVELTDPKKDVEAAGASIEVLSVKEGSIKGWKFTDWGRQRSGRQTRRKGQRRRL
jgi:protease I